MPLINSPRAMASAEPMYTVKGGLTPKSSSQSSVKVPFIDISKVAYKHPETPYILRAAAPIEAKTEKAMESIALIEETTSFSERWLSIANIGEGLDASMMIDATPNARPRRALEDQKVVEEGSFIWLALRFELVDFVSLPLSATLMPCSSHFRGYLNGLMELAFALMASFVCMGGSLDQI